MSLTKVNYIDNSTIITAKNLNDIQDNIIQNAELIKKAAPRNLLDNSDFTNPVNQRGNTEAEQAILIDRWWVFGGKAYLTANGITGDGGTFITQRLPIGTKKEGKTYTIAVYYADGTVDVNTNGIFNTNSEIGADIANNIYLNGKTITHVALYEGEYTADNLPEYQPKGYGVELVECQRYYLSRKNRITTSGMFDGSGCLDISVILPIEMRIKPTITLYSFDGYTLKTKGKVYIMAKNTYHEINALPAFIKNNCFGIRYIDNGFANSSCNVIYGFEASADL